MSRDDYIDEAGYVLTAGVYGLSGAEWLADLSLGKIRAAYNGIGPEWMSQSMRDNLNKYFGIFVVCAVIHDCRFAYCNDGTAAGFNAANDELDRNCRIVADANFKWWQLRRYLARRAGRIMADACREFGWSAWRDAYDAAGNVAVMIHERQFRSGDRNVDGERQTLSFGGSPSA